MVSELHRITCIDMDKASAGLNSRMRTIFMSYQMSRGRMSPYHPINAHTHPSQYSFADGTGGCAILELTSILETYPRRILPCLIAHNKYKPNNIVLTLCKALTDLAKPYPEVLSRLRLLLLCHVTGFKFTLKSTSSNRLDLEDFQGCFEETRKQFIPCLL